MIDRIRKDLLEATKAKDQVKTSTLRLLLSSLKNKEIELRGSGKELIDEESLSVVSKEVKQRKESMEEFKKAARSDLVDKEAAELRVLEGYMPEQMDREEVKELVEAAIRETGASGMQDMGKVMSILMPKVKGRADGSQVSSLVREALS